MAFKNGVGEAVRKDANVQRKPKLKSVPMCEQYRNEKRWVICAHEKVHSYERYTRELESVLFRRAQAEHNLGCVVTTGDKASLNNINKTGDFQGAGDASVKLVQDILQESMLRAYEEICGNPYLIRKNGGSDETVQLSAGDYNRLLEVVVGRPDIFSKIVEKVRRDYAKKLSVYEYKARKLRLDVLPEPVVEEVPLDLERYSRALKDPMLITLAHIGSPRVLRIADQEPGFIERTVADIDAQELIRIQSLLPPSFRPQLGSVPEFPGPFDQLMGFAPEKSCAIEIKFRHTDEYNRFAPLRVMGLAKKGIAEVMSGDVGLRYINTFYGKHVADHILSSVAHAMSRINNELRRVRKTESNLIYVVENSDSTEIQEKATELINNMIRENGLGRVGLVPSLTGINVGEDVHVNDLRASLAIKKMGMVASPEVLTYTDLLIAAVKIMEPAVIDEAIERSDKESIESGRIVLQIIRNQMEKEEGIRDTEDLVWKMRSYDEDPRKEKSVWDYAHKEGKKFRNRLIDVISSL